MSEMCFDDFDYDRDDNDDVITEELITNQTDCAPKCSVCIYCKHSGNCYAQRIVKSKILLCDNYERL